MTSDFGLKIDPSATGGADRFEALNTIGEDRDAASPGNENGFEDEPFAAGQDLDELIRLVDGASSSGGHVGRPAKRRSRLGAPRADTVGGVACPP